MSIHTDLQNLFTELKTNRDGYSIPLVVEGKLAWVSVKSKEFSDSLESLIEKTAQMVENELRNQNIQPELSEELTTFAHIFVSRIVVHATHLSVVEKVTQRMVDILTSRPMEEQFALTDMTLLTIDEKIMRQIVKSEASNKELTQKRTKLIAIFGEALVKKISAVPSTNPIPENQIQLMEAFLNPNGNSTMVNNFWNNLRNNEEILDLEAPIDEDQDFADHPPLLNPETESDHQLCALIQSVLIDNSHSPEEFLRNTLTYANQNPMVISQFFAKFMDVSLEAKPIQTLETSGHTREPTKDADTLLDDALNELDEAMMDEALKDLEKKN